ncbi:MAG: M23 family metallopeptidase [Pseudohongiella sp.]|nr:M23 family metallopeptidase [Pseudohongiella sp.]MDP1755984.1 M23 family metallopeptidase [Pseudohongiella sp.]
MPAIVQLGQLIIPVVLLLWLALMPAGGRMGLVLQSLSAAAMLWALALIGLWTLPPWWLPYLFGLCFVVIVVRHTLAGLSSVPVNRATGPLRTLLLIVGVVVGGVSVWLGSQALAGRQLPENVEVVDIALPFGSGVYLIANGGSTTLVNGHLRTLDPTVERYQRWRGQSRALDIFRVTSSGLHATQGLRPTDPASYATFGTPVLSPCSGRVALAVDGLEDMPVPQMDPGHMAGNFVAIDCGDFFVFLAHLRKGSLQVSPGDTVMVGDPLGQMGNSGNSSEPHLHLHAQRDLPTGFPLSGEPLSLTLNGQYPVRNTRIEVQ